MRLEKIWVLVLVVGLLAPIALADEGKASAAEEAGIRELLDALAAAQATGGEAQTALFDVSGLIEEMEATGLVPKIGPLERAGLRLGLRVAMQEKELVGLATAYDLRRIDKTADERAVATVVQQDEDGVYTKYRFHLGKQGTAWKVRDFEDLDLGMRTSVLMAAVLGPALAGDIMQPQLHAAAEALQEMGTLLDAEAWGEMLNTLHGIELESLPPAVQGLLLVGRGAALTGLERVEDAYTTFKRADALLPGAPALQLALANVEVLRGNHLKGMEHARAYMELLGDDPDARLVLARALHGLGKTEAALTRLLASLGEDPMHVESVLFLLEVIPDDRLEEGVEAFARLPNVRTDFDPLASELLDQGRVASLDAITTWFKTAHPDHYDGDYYAAELHARRGQIDEAVEAWRVSWTKAPEAWKEAVLERIVETLVDAGRPLEAFMLAPDPEGAFDLTAEMLSDEEDADAMTRLLETASAAPRRPPTLPLWRGEPAWIRGDWERVVAELGHELQAMGFDEPDGEDRIGRWGWADRRWHLAHRVVFALIRLGRLEEALPHAVYSLEEEEDPWFLFLIRLKQDDARRSLPLVRQMLDDAYTSPEAILLDPDVAPELDREALKPVRELLEEASDP